MRTLRNVEIVPYELLIEKNGCHCGGPIWPNWKNQTFARHHRAGRPVDTIPRRTDTRVHLDRPVAWGGAVVRHFGHQVADFSTRLLPTLEAWPDATFAFATHPRTDISVLAEAPPFFLQILEWFGISIDRVVLVAAPAIAGELRVAPQLEQIGGPGPPRRYLDRLDALTADRLGSNVKSIPKLFVSRAGVAVHCAGEAYLERFLGEQGVTVLRPETLPVIDQLRAYYKADRLLFTEGSALHGTQLLGRALGDVHVLVRRPNKQMAKSSLTRRARSLEYHQAVKEFVSPMAKGWDALHKGMTVLDLDLLSVALRKSFDIDFERGWDLKAFRSAEAHDVECWLRAYAHPRFWRAPNSRAHLNEVLERNGWGHLSSIVDFSK